MPKRADIDKVLIIGSGPIIIGQACEFDYSGTQACKALRAMGYKVVLVNSNPATIMTDPEMADATYIEPLTFEVVEKIIEKEKPDALLPNLGGQTGLNLAAELYRKGVLKKHGVKIIGVQADAIERGEDRIAFKETMNSLGIPIPRSEPAYSIEDAFKIAGSLGYPVVIRPAYTLGGMGGGVAYNKEELEFIARRGISASLIGQILIEEAVLGWEELELEVVRDSENNMITVCFIENVDPMGVHTGDSFCVAPMLTISKEVQNKLQDYSYKIVEAIGVVGGTNVQFAHNPEDGRIVVIEINPRTSRSSALASKATGFPIAYISSRLAGGDTLKDIPYWREGTLDKYTPSGDYVVVKFAKWAFEKFSGSEDRLGTEMKAVGEVMSIGKNYKEAFQKAIRSLEQNRYGLGFAKNFHKLSLDELRNLLDFPTSERQFIMYEALRKGMTVEELYQKTRIKPWFIEQMKELVEFEEEMLGYKRKELPNELMIKAKEDGFSDKYLSQILDISEEKIRERRIKLGKAQAWEPVPVSGADAYYYYSTYNASDKVSVSDKRKVMILGGGPNRIGQGIEFDYTCVHAAFALREEGYESIMVNCNPETVSTDYDTSDKLYFEPLTVEDVLSIYNKEKPIGVIAQFGGQTPLNIAKALEAAKVNFLGTSPESIDLAEDRKRFSELLERLNIPSPPHGTATSFKEALEIARRIGYPILVRPSYVLGGRAMEFVYTDEMLEKYILSAVEVSPDHPILIDRFLEEATEVDCDAICDGKNVLIGGVMEHIEEAGVHSGDSACALPPFLLKKEEIETIKEYTIRLAKELKVIGLLNIQYAVKDGIIYVLEVNPRASRTVPFISKCFGVPLAKIATKVVLGKTLKELGFEGDGMLPFPEYFAVKEAVFPFKRFPEVDTVLGPEMKSTGEVMGIDKTFAFAFAKSQLAAGQELPSKGKVFISVCNRDKPKVISIAKKLLNADFEILATKGTAEVLISNDVSVKEILKVSEGRPNVIDLIKSGDIQLIINTPWGKGPRSDGYYIRTAASNYGIPLITTISGASAAVEAITALASKELDVKPIQDFHSEYLASVKK